MRVEPAVDGLDLSLDSEADTELLGRALAEAIGPGRVIGLIGGLGSGKTRLVRALSEATGVNPAAIASPTFVLIHEYQGRLPIYHFDAYRLTGPDEFDALGAAEYFEAGGICLVEWADLVSDRLPVDAILIRLEPTGPNSRAVSIRGPGLDRLAEAFRDV